MSDQTDWTGNLNQGGGLQILAWRQHVFVNKDFLRHGFTRKLIVYGCFHSAMAELSSGDRDHMASKPQVFTIKPFKKMFADAWSRVQK